MSKRRTGRIEPLVTVVIPLHNHEQTIAEAVGSVLAQTLKDFELIVVNDGSTDGSRSAAQAAAARDSRVEIIDRPNGGVAAARNAGIQLARGRFVAPLDADDLWHAEKLERQLAVFERADPAVGLVYNWFRKIDAAGRVVEAPFAPLVEGWVLREHLKWNFIGNGSTPLIKAEAVRGLSYSPELRAGDNQGCEDYLLQLLIASRFQFACAPAFLTGYRTSPGAMSSDVGRMIRSHIQMYRMLLESLPARERPAVERQLARRLAAHGLLELSRRRMREGAGALASALAKSPADTLAGCSSLLCANISRKFHSTASPGPDTLVGRMFFALSPDEGVPAALA